MAIVGLHDELQVSMLASLACLHQLAVGLIPGLAVGSWACRSWPVSIPPILYLWDTMSLKRCDSAALKHIAVLGRLGLGGHGAVASVLLC